MRRIKPEIKNSLRDAFMVMSGSGVPIDGMIEMATQHTVGLLEHIDEHPEWFQNSDNSTTESVYQYTDCDECGAPIPNHSSKSLHHWKHCSFFDSEI